MKKVLRSLIHEAFPLDLRIKIELLSRRRDISNKEKQDDLMKLLREYDLSERITPLGSGTNRYAFKLDGYVIKVATDNDGKIDNMKEFKMAPRLFPYVTKIFEVSDSGTLLVAEYIQPFTSYGEMLQYADQIRDILKELSTVYLIGDVGITNKNYSNWGTRIGFDDPVCLDFAYVYEVKSELFLCRNCNSGSILVPDKDFTNLICPNPSCGKKYHFEDIRAKLGNDVHNHEIGILSDEGYVLKSSNIEMELDPSRSNYLRKKSNKVVKKEIKKEDEVPVDNFIMEHDPEYYRRIEMRPTELNDVSNYVGGKLNIRANAKIMDDYPDPKPVFDKRFPDPLRNVETRFPIDESFEGYVKHVNQMFSEKPFEIKIVGNNNIPENINYLDDSPYLKAKARVMEREREYREELLQEKLKSVQQLAPGDQVVTLKGNSEVLNTYQFKDSNDDGYVNESFKRGAFKTVSLFSNKVGDYFKSHNLYNSMRTHDLSDEKDPNSFYAKVQNAVFRSFMKYFMFKEYYVDRDGVEVKRFAPPEEVNNKYYSRELSMFEKFSLDPKFQETTNIREYLQEFYKTYSNYDFSRDYFEALLDRLYEKMNFTAEGNFSVASMVWHVIGNGSEKHLLDPNGLNDECNCGHDHHTHENYEIDEMYDEEGFNGIQIDVYPDEFKGDQKDMIRIYASDHLGDIEMPVYCNLDKTEKEESENGIWEFLSTIPAQFYLKTKDVERWLELNNIPLDEDQVKVISLNKVNDETIMGVYFIKGIYNKGETLIKDESYLSKINDSLVENIKGTPFDIHRYITELDHLVFVEENEILEILSSIDSFDHGDISEKEEIIKEEIVEEDMGTEVIVEDFRDTVENNEENNEEDNAENNEDDPDIINMMKVSDAPTDDMDISEEDDKYKNLVSGDPKLSKYMDTKSFEPIRRKPNSEK